MRLKSSSSDNCHLSKVRATTMRMDALITVSEMTILASQAYSPKGHGYWFHMRYNSEGIPMNIEYLLVFVWLLNVIIKPKSKPQWVPSASTKYHPPPVTFVYEGGLWWKIKSNKHFEEFSEAARFWEFEFLDLLLLSLYLVKKSSIPLR